MVGCIEMLISFYRDAIMPQKHIFLEKIVKMSLFSISGHPTFWKISENIINRFQEKCKNSILGQIGPIFKPLCKTQIFLKNENRNISRYMDAQLSERFR